MKDLKWREILVVVIFIVGMVYLTPTLSPSLPSWWKGFLPKEKIHLGLDLQGGMHLVLEVEADKAVENHAERLADDLKEDPAHGTGAVRQSGDRPKAGRSKPNWPVRKTRLNSLKSSRRPFPFLKSTGAETVADGVHS